MNTIESLRTFVRVVETGSLTAVAREMNSNQSNISRQITQLEDHSAYDYCIEQHVISA